MAEKLNFTLPEKKPKGSAGGALTMLLSIVLVALVGANLYITLSEEKPQSARVGSLSVEQAREMAGKLAQRGLYRQAAAAWQDYLAAAQPTDAQRAQIHFQIGGLLEKAGLYGDAIEQYYRSEAAAELAELGPQINARVKECFERLGKFSALRYEVMDRTSMKPGQSAGGKVVAEIGAEKITESQLDALIEESIEDLLFVHVLRDAPWNSFAVRRRSRSFCRAGWPRRFCIARPSINRSARSPKSSGWCTAWLARH